MKPINRIFLFLLFISVSYAISYAQENQSYFLHTIEKGQSLYSISKMYNVTTSDIIRLNPGCDEKIYAGQTIKIPTGKESQKGETFHTIQAGETLYKLTTMYNVSAKDICEANPGLSAENFRIGQVILIPQKKEEQTDAVVQTPTEQSTIQGPVVPRCKDMHKVKRKETIFSVSREYGISEQELIDANPELKKGMKKGQFLCIPYPAATTVQPTQKEDPYAVPPSNSELFRKVKGEVFLRIQQNLMALPGQTIEEITEVHSHYMAIAQTREFFKSYPHIRLVESEDTAKSAADIMRNGQRRIGAIASELAAELFGLEILQASIETHKQNFTRFLILDDHITVSEKDIDKSSICFTLPHKTGRLSQVLSIFAFYDLNLTKIQSLPIPGKEWQYFFYVDLKFDDYGHYLEAMNAVRPLVDELTVMGEYKSYC